MRDGDPDVLKEQRAASDGALAMAIKAIARDSRQVHRNEERGHTVRAGFHCSGATEDDGRIGLVGGGDRGLFAVDDVFVAVAFDA